jgi:hypothetical protein
MDVETFIGRREAASADLARLEEARGVAWLDGEAFDSSLIDAKQAELAAIDSAEVEASRRERAAMARALAKARAEARKEARKELAAYQASLSRAEASAKALVAEIAALQSSSVALAGLCRRMGVRPPAYVGRQELDTVLSRLIAGELMKVGSVAYYGNMKWPGTVEKPDWSAHARRVSDTLAPTLEGEPE